MAIKRTLQQWSVEDSTELYGIRNWGAGYFGVSPEGDVVIYPSGENKGVAVSVPEVIRGMRERGYDMPVLLRIENILDSQITLLHESFRKAIASLGYKGEYRGVFPIKVNQQQHTVEKIAQFGSRFHHGLEVGSKAELISAISQLKDPEACLICNGYKDEEFIDLGLSAVRMGFKCIFVMEMPGELELILERSAALGVRPLLGVRVKLITKGSGHWAGSCGERSAFGLTTAQVVDIVDTLKQHDMLDCLQLLHYHLGSQVPNIRDIRTAVMESTRVYAGLVQEGAKMGYLDLGGGLACIEVIGTGVQRIHHQLIGILVLEIDDDDALLGEHEANAAHLAQIATELVKVVAHVGSRAVAVIGQGLDHNGDAAGAITLIGDCLILGLVATLGALDDTLDVVVRHTVGLGLGDQRSQLGVGGGVAAALLNGNGDLTADLGENLGAGAVSLFLFAFNVIPFAMSGHGKSP